MWLMLYLSVNPAFAEGRLYAVDRETLIIRQYKPYRNTIRIKKGPTVKLYRPSSPEEITFYETKQLLFLYKDNQYNIVWCEINYKENVVEVYIFPTGRRLMEEYIERR